MEECYWKTTKVSHRFNFLWTPVPLLLAFGGTAANNTLKYSFYPSYIWTPHVSLPSLLLAPLPAPLATGTAPSLPLIAAAACARVHATFWPPPSAHVARPLLAAVVAAKNQSQHCLVPPLEIQIWQLHHPNFFGTNDIPRIRFY